MKTFITPMNDPIYNYHFPHPVSKVCFFDIETTGLSPQVSSLYLIGAMCYDTKANQWMLHQWFADDTKSEKELLLSFLTFLQNYEYLYHFNGKTFDIPYILKKCQRHKITIPDCCHKILYDSSAIFSIDLLTAIRSLRHSLSLTKCNQTAIEQWLGIHRTDTFSGGELIPVYAEYIQCRLLSPEKCENFEKTLLLHNHDDIAMMLTICSMLHYGIFLYDATKKQGNILKSLLSDISITDTMDDHRLSLSFRVPFHFPKPLTIRKEFPAQERCLDSSDTIPDSETALPSLHFQEDTVTVCYPLIHTTLKFFFPNPKEYYYLPEEDMAIHKSIAEFVEPAYRKKASAATCYTKKTGYFLPSLIPANQLKKINSPLEHFFAEYKAKRSYYLLPENNGLRTEFFRHVLADELGFFRK